MDKVLKEIRVLMLRKGWKIKDVAAIWKLSESQTSSILSGRTSMKVKEHLLPLCDKGNVTLSIQPE